MPGGRLSLLLILVLRIEGCSRGAVGGVREPTDGNYCTLKIVVDKELIRVTDSGRRDRIENDIDYIKKQANKIFKIFQVEYLMAGFIDRKKPFQFEVVKKEFWDDEKCSENPEFFACKNRTRDDADKYLADFARINHEDVCMAIALTGFDFGERLGTAFKDKVCATFEEQSIRPRGPVELFSGNVGYVSYGGTILSKTAPLTFVHEIGHIMGASHDGDFNECQDGVNVMTTNFPTIQDGGSLDSSFYNFSECSQRDIRKALDKLSRVRYLVGKLLKCQQDTERQCLKECQDLPGKPIEECPGPRSLLTNSNIVVGVVILLLVLTIVLFACCAFSRRDLSFSSKTFGERYSQIRRGAAQTVRSVSRLGKRTDVEMGTGIHKPEPAMSNPLDEPSVSSMKKRWEVGGMVREDAERALKGDVNGSFLVRTSKNGLTLSFKNQQGKIKHIKLKQAEGQITADGGKNYFNGIDDLVENYVHNPIPGTQDFTLKL